MDGEETVWYDSTRIYNEEMLLHLGLYIDHLINLPNNNTKKCYQAYEELVLLLPCKFVTRKYACLTSHIATLYYHAGLPMS